MNKNINDLCNQKLLDFYNKIKDLDFESEKDREFYIKLYEDTIEDLRNLSNEESAEIKPNKYDLHKEICKKIHNQYVKKNTDYGDSVGDTYKKYGMISFIVRMTDKLNRIASLTNNKINLVKDETIEDTLEDLANYAIIALVEYKYNKPNKNDEVSD